MNDAKVVLVTGASSGIGEQVVMMMLEKGYIVYAAARRVEKMKTIEEKGGHVCFIDLTNDDSVKSCVSEIYNKEGGIDILVNNAGYGSYGAIEDVSIDEGRRQFEVNLFGLARLTQLVLPAMRKKGWGRIVNISSIAGWVYSPFGAWYYATKHALEGWTDALRTEVKTWGIDVVLVEPGLVFTDWGIIAAKNLEKNSAQGVYALRAKRVANLMTKLYSEGVYPTVPEKLAKVIVKAAVIKYPKTRYRKGFGANSFYWSRRILPDKWFDYIVCKIIGG